MSVVKTHTKRVMDLDTFEIEDFTQMTVTKTDFDFDKIWTAHLGTILDLVGSKPMKILAWFIEGRNHENLIIGTYSKIAESAGCSQETVRQTVKLLLGSGVISKVQNGLYRVNPDLVWRGDAGRRQSIIIEYQREGGAAIPIRTKKSKESISMEEDLLQRIQSLDDQARDLKEQLAAIEGRKTA